MNRTKTKLQHVPHVFGAKSVISRWRSGCCSRELEEHQGFPNLPRAKRAGGTQLGQPQNEHCTKGSQGLRTKRNPHVRNTQQHGHRSVRFCPKLLWGVWTSRDLVSAPKEVTPLLTRAQPCHLPKHQLPSSDIFTEMTNRALRIKCSKNNKGQNLKTLERR